MTGVTRVALEVRIGWSSQDILSGRAVEYRDKMDNGHSVVVRWSGTKLNLSKFWKFRSLQM